MFMRPTLERNIRRLWEAPPGLAGRVAAARIRTDQHDVVFILVYCPVRRSLVEKDYVECVQKICGFVDRVMSECGERTLPVVAGDFNDQFGLRRQADGRVRAHGLSTTGEHNLGEEHYAAKQFQELFQVHHMQITTTMCRLPPTYRGATGTTSHIDHFVMPETAYNLVEHIGVSFAASRRAQVIADKRYRDHMPLRLVLRAPYHSPLAKRIVLDRDVLMRELCHGDEVRANFMQAVEEALRSVPEDEWRRVDDKCTPDEHWGVLAGIVQAQAIAHFGKVRENQLLDQDPEYGEARQRREELLRLRRRLRDTGEMGDMHALGLTMIGRRLRRQRRRYYERRQEILMDELCEAWRRRQFHEVHRYRSWLAQNMRGPKKRKFNAPKRCQPTAEEWRQYMGGPGAQGGMLCEPINEAEYISAYEEQRRLEDDTPFYRDANLSREAMDDLAGVRKYLKRCPKRKSFPRWASPAECWHMLLMPRRRLRERGQGVGYQRQHDDRYDNPVFQKRTLECMKHIRATAWAPLQWHKSCAFTLDKCNGKEGVAADVAPL